MKTKASTLLKFTACVLIAASVSACNQNKTAGSTAAAGSATPASGNGIVFINQDTVSLKYEYAKDMHKRLDDKGKAVQSDVGARQQAIQREYVEYQKGANTLSADQRASTEQRLQREGQEFQQYQQNAGAQFQSEQASEQQKLYEKVYTFTKQYAKENGYKIVLAFQSGDTHLLYADQGLDVTADFLKKLNDAYGKEKK